MRIPREKYDRPPRIAGPPTWATVIAIPPTVGASFVDFMDFSASRPASSSNHIPTFDITRRPKTWPTSSPYSRGPSESEWGRNLGGLRPLPNPTAAVPLEIGTRKRVMSHAQPGSKGSPCHLGQGPSGDPRRRGFSSLQSGRINGPMNFLVPSRPGFQPEGA